MRAHFVDTSIVSDTKSPIFIHPLFITDDETHDVGDAFLEKSSVAKDKQKYRVNRR